MLDGAVEALGRVRLGPEARRRRLGQPVGVSPKLLGLARLVAHIAEEDDLYFARALFVLRRALLARGERLVARGALDRIEDVFLLPLLPEPEPGPHLRRRVAAARARLRRRHRLDPPTSIVRGVPAWEQGTKSLRGVGCGGRAKGRVVRHEGAGPPTGIPEGSVLVCTTLLPSWTFVLPSLAAVVAEEGGALSHGAILAREYGVPAVFGVRGALRTLQDGEWVIVDGTEGRVMRFPGPSWPHPKTHEGVHGSLG